MALDLTYDPKVGDVIAGHKFLGGNPAAPKSWESLGIAAQ